MSSHADTCATGARAELRGNCDCGAVIVRPWRIREVSLDKTSDRLVEFEVDGPLTTRDAVDLSISLQSLAIEVAHSNIARRDRRRTRL